MRREILYLTDIVEAADYIATFIAGLGFEEFQESELVRSAVVQKLAIIGEAASRLSDDLRARNSHVPWPQIVAFRNVLVHAYFGIDWWEVGLGQGAMSDSSEAGRANPRCGNRPSRMSLSGSPKTDSNFKFLHRSTPCG